MSRQLLIVNAQEETGGVATSFEEIRGGYLGIIEAGELLSSISGSETQLAVGNITTSPFKSTEVVRSVKQLPSAATKGVMSLNFTNAKEDLPKYVKLIDTTIGTMDNFIKNFEADTLQGIVDLINAEAAKTESVFYGYSASLSDQTITVTGASNKTFRVAGTEGVAISVVTAAKTSVGQSDDIKKLEKETLPYIGVTNQVGHPVVKPESKVVDGAEYIQYVLDIEREVPNKAGTGSKQAANYQIIIAVKSDLDKVIASLDGDAVVEDN